MCFPQLYQVNLRFWLSQRSAQLERQAALDDLPDEELRRLAELGFDWLYLLGAWQTGKAEAALARGQAFLQAQARQMLGGAGADAICASPFAVAGYRVPRQWGGDAALARLRQRLHAHGLRLMLDFIPNHTGVSHPWAVHHPDYYVSAPPDAQPGDFQLVQTDQGARRLAHGRDPFFPPWSDTFQLDYANPAMQQALAAELLRLGEVCDGLRCDMAMLALPEVFERTWKRAAPPFWQAALARLKTSQPEFVLLAEVYWGLESTLLKQGFDYAYDKSLLDRLIEMRAAGVRRQIEADHDLQTRLARFLENHDEPRVAARLPLPAHRCAALIAFFQPGLRFFYAGQLEGRRLRAPVQFCYPPAEPDDPPAQAFYRALLEQLKAFAPQPGSWTPLRPRSAWDGNPTWANFIACTWLDQSRGRWLALANYAGYQGQCYVPLAFSDLSAADYALHDRLGEAVYTRASADLRQRGLYLDLPAWGLHLFQILPATG